MPRHEDIEQFKRVLASYGAGPSEQAATTTRGRTAPAATEAEAPGEPGDELGELAGLGGTGVPEAPETLEEGVPPDIGDLLSSLGGELAGGPSPEPAPGDENLDLSALFGEEESGAIVHAEAAEGPPKRERRRKPKPAKPPRQARERRARRAEPEPSPEEEAALEELAVPEELAAPEELPVLEELSAPEAPPVLEELAAPEAPPVPEAPAAPEEFAAPGELPSPEEPGFPEELPAPEELGIAEELPAPEAPPSLGIPTIPEDLTAPEELPAPEGLAFPEEPAESLELGALEELAAPEEFAAPGKVEAAEEPSLPFMEGAEPAEPLPAPAAPGELPEAPPEFRQPVEPISETETAAGPTAEEELLKPIEGAEELPSLTGDIEQFGVLPEEAAPEPDLSGLETGVTPSELPDIGDLDELTLPEEGTAAPAAPRAGRAPQPVARGVRRPAARVEPSPRRPARPPREEPVRVRAEQRAGEGPAQPVAAAVPVGEIQLTDEQFDRLRRSLGILPRNLKIAVQDIVAGAVTPTADLAALIGLLVTGANPKEIAALAGKITGKRIRIPAAYERRTGLAFEREQRTFAYAFRQNILPLVRLFALAVIGAGLAGFLGYRFVWQPLSATANYRRGYEQLQAERYPIANERFERAARAWPMRRWYFRYADAFTQKRQYDLAAEKYEQMLVRWPNDRKAVLDWASMESKLRARYEQADKILHRILDRRPSDYDALLAAGDNFLEWAAEEPIRYEDARLSWAELMKTHGQRDEVLFRMLRYFVRTDNLVEAERLRAVFFGRRRFAVDTEAAGSLAELGGYLVERRQLDWVHDVLSKAAAAAPNLPEVSYQFARFYRAMEEPALEEQALSNALRLMEPGQGARTLRVIEMQIDAQTRLGEMYYEEQKYLDASRELRKAVTLVEKERRDGVIGESMWRDATQRGRRLGRLLGRPYAKLADISYYVEGDLAAAAGRYRTAAGYGYTGSEIDYKLGFISYAAGDWLAALASFSAAEEGLARAAFAAPGDEAVGARAASSPGRAPINLLFAQGNAFYRRGDLFAAQGSWLRVLEAVETRLAVIDELAPLTRPDHRALLEYRLRADNNLGVATAQLAGRTGDRRRTSQALAYLAEAAETADLLARAPETLVASEAISLPALNLRGVLYPLANFELQIYKAIAKDLEARSF